MNASFDKSRDAMSLWLDYDAAKPTDCEEAARLVEAFSKAAEKSNSGAFGAFAPPALFGNAIEQRAAAEQRMRTEMTDSIQTAIKSTNGKAEYYRGFRNALRYAQWLVDGTVPQYEGPTLGNDTAAADATADTQGNALLSTTIEAAARATAKVWNDFFQSAFGPLNGERMEANNEPQRTAEN